MRWGAAGDCLQHRGSADARCLAGGSRLPPEVVTYPDHDRVLHAAGENRHFTTLDGTQGVSSAYSLPGA